MIDLYSKTLILLPHLDDEFALTPLIKNMSKHNNIYIIYCAERLSSKKKELKKRREDNLRALEYLGVKSDKIAYLNDKLNIEDNTIYKSGLEIIKNLEYILDNSNFKQVFTLNLEGGHPDHDYLALLVNKLATKYKFKPFYFPAYNYRRFLFLPYSILKPLKSQERDSKIIIFNYFCWIRVLIIALFYRTERIAFIKLLPGLIYKSFFSRRIIYYEHININYIKWSESLTTRRYNISINDLIKRLKNIPI